MPPPVTPAYPDQVLLKNALEGQSLPPGDVADLTDRLLTEGSPTFQEDGTMARLELLLLKTLKDGNLQYRSRLLRNLGIIHYHQKQYKHARQELQASNELNPRDARTHYYLARLFAHQGAVYQKRGLKKKAGGQFKLAAMELGLARKLEPSNPVYQQDVKQILQGSGK